MSLENVRGSMIARLEPLCHQETVVIRVASAAIELGGGIIAVVNFKMNRVHPELARTLFDKFHGLAADSLPAILRLDVKLVNEGVGTVKLETEAKGKHGIADGRLFVEEDPRSPEARIGKKSSKSLAVGCFIEIGGARLLFGEVAHHWSNTVSSSLAAGRNVTVAMIPG